MRALGVIVDKQLRNTVLVSLALHVFCLACISFTFVDRINFSLDLNIGFLGPILKESDIVSGAAEKTENPRMDISHVFSSKKYEGSIPLSYHLVADRPNRSNAKLFTDKKNSARFIALFTDARVKKQEESQEVEMIEQAPDWKKGLKLKVE